jgi:hypothetical protein
MIRTRADLIYARQLAGTLDDAHTRDAFEHFTRFVRAHAGVAQYDMTPRADLAPLYARIEQNRWIVDCPYCSGAELVDPAYSYFACCSCESPVRVVIFPLGRGVIEALLTLRPDPLTRNWAEPETVNALVAENKELIV